MAACTKTEKVQLHVPKLEELCEVLQNGLKSNFADAKVTVVECPDLSQDPFNFPAKGLCGSPRITDVGGVPYLIPLVQLDKFGEVERRDVVGPLTVNENRKKRQPLFFT